MNTLFATTNGSYGNLSIAMEKEPATYANSLTTKKEKPIASTRNGSQKKDSKN